MKWTSRAETWLHGGEPFVKVSPYLQLIRWHGDTVYPCLEPDSEFLGNFLARVCP